MAENTRSWVNEATVIAAVPAVGYAVAYMHEAGYCAHFDLPSELIALEVVAVLRAVLSVAAALAVVVYLGNALTVFDDGPYESRLRLSGMCLLATVPLAFWSGFSRAVTQIVGLLLFTALFQGWVRPLVRYSSVAGYTNKLKADDERVAAELANPAQPGVPVIHAALYTGRVWAQAAFFLAWILSASYLSGGHTARVQWEFFVVQGPEPAAIFRIYGDKALTAPFDHKHWKLGRETRIVRLDAGTRIRLENLGRLNRPEGDRP